jgi:hypothetical protein
LSASFIGYGMTIAPALAGAMLFSVIASEAKQSSAAPRTGLLRRRKSAVADLRIDDADLG